MRKMEIYERCIIVKREIESSKGKMDSLLKVIKKEIPEQSPKEIVEEQIVSEYVGLYNDIYRSACDNLTPINYFTNIIDNMELETILCLDSQIVLSNMHKTISALYDKLDCITSLLQENAHMKEETIGLDIKIPRLNSITDFKRYIDDLEFILTKCPFFQNKDATLKLETVDSGSIWLIFGIICTSVAAGSAFLNNIAAFIDKCFVIRSHNLSCERQKQEIERAQMEQKEKEELLKHINRAYRISVGNAIRDLQVITGCPIQDGEEMGRAEQSLERMTKLLEQGLQIYASIDSPQEVKALFDPLEMHYLSTEKELKKIEKKSETDSE